MLPASSASAATIPANIATCAQPISAIGANYFQVKNGKITYMRTIHDTVPFKPMTEQKFEDVSANTLRPVYSTKMANDLKAQWQQTVP